MRKERKLGIKGSPTRELHFDNVPHPRRPDDRDARARASRSRCAPWTTRGSRSAPRPSGIAQGALDYALGYVKERKQFGKAIAEFQGLQFMLADMAMKLEAARQLVYVAAAEVRARGCRT